MSSEDEFIFKGNKVRLNSRSPVRVKKKAYEGIKQKESYSDYSNHFDVYLWKRGCGHKPQLLFTSPEKRIEAGEQDLFIEELSNLENFPLSQRGESVLSENLEKDDGVEERAFTLALPAVEEDVKDLVDGLSPGEVRELIDEYLLGAGAVDIDKDVLYVLRSYFIEYNPAHIDPEVAMPLNPHALIYTNPYVGKSTTFDKIGEKYDYCKPAKVLGWSGADRNEKGALDELTVAFGLDELNEGSHGEGFLKRGLLPLMRNGKYKAAQGQGVNTKTWSPLVFMSNPKTHSDHDLVKRFRENLSTLSDNYGALGSRLGVVLYGEDFDTVEERNGNRIREEKAGKVVKSLFELSSEAFSKIVQKSEIQDWLNEGFPESYEKEIERRTEDEIPIPEVQRFWREHLKASKHARGHALRNSVIDNIPNIVHGVYNVQEIIDSAESHFSRLMEINRRSLRNISSMVDQEVYQDILRKDLESLNPKYMRFFTYGVIKAIESRDIDYTKFQPMEVVRNPYHESRDNFFTEEDSSQYRKYSTIKERVEGSDKNKRAILASRLGIEISELDGQTMWRVKDRERVEELIEAVDL